MPGKYNQKKPSRAMLMKSKYAADLHENTLGNM